MEKAEEIRIISLVKNELAGEITQIKEDKNKSNEQRQQEIAYIIEEFCKFYHIEGNESIEYLKRILEETEKNRIAMLVELELNKSIQAVIEDERMSSKEQLARIQATIEEFCINHCLGSKEEAEYVKSILKKMADSARANQEMDQTMDFYEGNTR